MKTLLFVLGIGWHAGFVSGDILSANNASDLSKVESRKIKHTISRIFSVPHNHARSNNGESYRKLIDILTNKKAQNLEIGKSDNTTGYSDTESLSSLYSDVAVPTLSNVQTYHSKVDEVKDDALNRARSNLYSILLNKNANTESSLASLVSTKETELNADTLSEIIQSLNVNNLTDLGQEQNKIRKGKLVIYYDDNEEATESPIEITTKYQPKQNQEHEDEPTESIEEELLNMYIEYNVPLEIYDEIKNRKYIHPEYRIKDFVISFLKYVIQNGQLTLEILKKLERIIEKATIDIDLIKLLVSKNDNANSMGIKTITRNTVTDAIEGISQNTKVLAKENIYLPDETTTILNAPVINQIEHVLKDDTLDSNMYDSDVASTVRNLILNPKNSINPAVSPDQKKKLNDIIFHPSLDIVKTTNEKLSPVIKSKTGLFGTDSVTKSFADLKNSFLESIPNSSNGPKDIVGSFLEQSNDKSNQTNISEKIESQNNYETSQNVFENERPANITSDDEMALSHDDAVREALKDIKKKKNLRIVHPEHNCDDYGLCEYENEIYAFDLKKLKHFLKGELKNVVPQLDKLDTNVPVLSNRPVDEYLKYNKGKPFLIYVVFPDSDKSFRITNESGQILTDAENDIQDDDTSVLQHNNPTENNKKGILNLIKIKSLDSEIPIDKEVVKKNTYNDVVKEIIQSLPEKNRPDDLLNIFKKAKVVDQSLNPMYDYDFNSSLINLLNTLPKNENNDLRNNENISNFLKELNSITTNQKPSPDSAANSNLPRRDKIIDLLKELASTTKSSNPNADNEQIGDLLKKLVSITTSPKPNQDDVHIADLLKVLASQTANQTPNPNSLTESDIIKEIMQLIANPKDDNDINWTPRTNVLENLEKDILYKIDEVLSNPQKYLNLLFQNSPLLNHLRRLITDKNLYQKLLNLIRIGVRGIQEGNQTKEAEDKEIKTLTNELITQLIYLRENLENRNVPRSEIRRIIEGEAQKGILRISTQSTASCAKKVNKAIELENFTPIFSQLLICFTFIGVSVNIMHLRLLVFLIVIVPVYLNEEAPKTRSDSNNYPFVQCPSQKLLKETLNILRENIDKKEMLSPEKFKQILDKAEEYLETTHTLEEQPTDIHVENLKRYLENPNHRTKKEVRTSPLPLSKSENLTGKVTFQYDLQGINPDCKELFNGVVSAINAVYLQMKTFCEATGICNMKNENPLLQQHVVPPYGRLPSASGQLSNNPNIIDFLSSYPQNGNVMTLLQNYKPNVPNFMFGNISPNYKENSVSGEGAQQSIDLNSFLQSHDINAEPLNNGINWQYLAKLSQLNVLNGNQKLDPFTFIQSFRPNYNDGQNQDELTNLPGDLPNHDVTYTPDDTLIQKYKQIGIVKDSKIPNSNQLTLNSVNNEESDGLWNDLTRDQPSYLEFMTVLNQPTGYISVPQSQNNNPLVNLTTPPNKTNENLNNHGGFVDSRILDSNTFGSKVILGKNFTELVANISGDINDLRLNNNVQNYFRPAKSQIPFGVNLPLKEINSDNKMRPPPMYLENQNPFSNSAANLHGHQNSQNVLNYPFYNQQQQYYNMPANINPPSKISKHTHQMAPQQSYLNWYQNKRDDFHQSFQNKESVGIRPEHDITGPVPPYASLLQQQKGIPSTDYHFAHHNNSLELSDSFRLTSMTNGPKLNMVPNKNGVVELTFTLQRPQSYVYKPLYYVKYRLPYETYMYNVQNLLQRRPFLRNNPSKLYQDLLAVANISESSQDLKDLAKEEISHLVASSGALVKARVLDEFGEANKGVDSDIKDILRSASGLSAAGILNATKEAIHGVDTVMNSTSVDLNKTSTLKETPIDLPTKSIHARSLRYPNPTLPLTPYRYPFNTNRGYGAGMSKYINRQIMMPSRVLG
ncbi:unnamed protein product [Leptosia nina]|uniref:Uncharacterized protein n=1 Tax=Leptosia nina TaxID=320188 RepID=A0AAV1JIM7_9NEOP